jgi:hypothetical protein
MNAIPASVEYGTSYMGYREEPTAGDMILDFLVARPAGLVASTIGIVFYIVSLPFSAPTGSDDEAYAKLVMEPVQFTFGRPLGVFDSYGISVEPSAYRQ